MGARARFPILETRPVLRFRAFPTGHFRSPLGSVEAPIPCPPGPALCVQTKSRLLTICGLRPRLPQFANIFILGTARHQIRRPALIETILESRLKMVIRKQNSVIKRKQGILPRFMPQDYLCIHISLIGALNKTLLYTKTIVHLVRDLTFPWETIKGDCDRNPNIMKLYFGRWGAEHKHWKLVFSSP